MAINSADGTARLLLGHAGGEEITVSVWRLPKDLAELQFEDVPVKDDDLPEKDIVVAMIPEPAKPKRR